VVAAEAAMANFAAPDLASLVRIAKRKLKKSSTWLLVKKGPSNLSRH
jgi:hypothetical protein